MHHPVQCVISQFLLPLIRIRYAQIALGVAHSPSGSPGCALVHANAPSYFVIFDNLSAMVLHKDALLVKADLG